MVSVPLEWTISLKGGQEVKTTLDQLTQSLKRGEISREEYNKTLAKGNRTAIQALNTDRYQMNVLKAQYPALQRVSRAISTVTSISRSLLTISNAMNLSKIAGSTLDREDIEIKKQIRKNNELIAEELKKRIPDMEKVNALQQENNELMGISKEKAQALIDQKWDGMLTAIESTVFGIGTIFTNLLNNATIFKAISKAGGFLGGVFSGFFTLAAKTGIAISSWMLLHLTGPSPLAASTKSGTTLGTAFGWAFTVAAALAIASAAVLLIDVIEQKLFGTSPLKKLTGTSGAEAIKGATGIDVLGFEPGSSDDPAVKRLHPKTQSGFPPRVSRAPSLSIQKNKPADPQILIPAKQNNELIKTNNVLFKDLNHTIDESSKVMIEGNSVLEEYYRYREQFDPTDKSARERMRMETERLAKETTKSTMASTALTNKLDDIKITVGISKKGTLVTGVTATMGGAGYINAISPNDNIYGAGMFLGTNGKYYTSQHEAYINGAWPVDAVAAANGFNGMVNSPTMFLAGEAGPEHVSITPSGKSSGGNTIIINVAGSVVTERKLAYMVDQYQKQNLKSRGFTGFG